MELRPDNDFQLRLAGIFIVSAIILGDVLFVPPHYWDPLPRWVVLSPLILFALGMIFSVLGSQTRYKKESEKAGNLYLKVYGKKIIVDLNTCELQENDQTTSQLATYRDTHSNDFFSSSDLPYNRETLLQKFKEKKATFIYVDKRNKDRYFFDLDFILD